MPAYVAVAAPGRACTVICPECDLIEPYERTRPAQDAAALHNRERHAYPDPLPIDTEETA